MTSRAKLQEKNLDELRVIAAAIAVPDHDSLQKSKLIAAILDSDKFDASDLPAPVEVPTAETRRPGPAAEASTRTASVPASSAPAAEEEDDDSGESSDVRNDSFDDAGNRKRREIARVNLTLCFPDLL